LKNLVSIGAIEQRSVSIKGSSGADTLVYATDGFATLTGYEKLLREREALLRPESLGHVGESYVRGLLKRSNRFRNVTPRTRLGHVWIAAGSTGDITAQLRGAARLALLFEVKNRREVFDYSADAFPRLLAKAIIGRYQPVFVSSFLSERARRFCAALGIATLTLERQLLPRRYSDASGDRRWTRQGLKNLVSTVGPSPIEIVSAKRFYQHGLSRAGKVDMSRVQDPDWLLTEARVWAGIMPIVQRYLSDASWLVPPIGAPWNAVMARELGSRIGWAP
jgi:hypothetical protein